MTQLLSIIIAAAGIGFAVSGLFPAWLTYPLGFAVLLASPLLGVWLSKLIDPQIVATEKRFQERLERKAQKRFVAENREKIGFQYFRTTFLLAGHIAAADGHVCEQEKQVLEQRFSRLQLDKAQVQAANDYFKQGQSPQFNVGEELNVFMQWCGNVPELCQSLLSTQFAFVEADEVVGASEFRIVRQIAVHLGLQQQFHDLLESYRLQVEEAAEKIAKEKIEAHKRQRDKKRYEAEKARLQKKLSSKERKLRLAFSLLGLSPKASITEIKRAYRKQIKRHHPDTLLANGYPQALLAEATRRSAEINKAYQLLKTHYHFR